MQSRYYDPEVGRFLNADDDTIIDPVALSANLVQIFIKSDLNLNVSLESPYALNICGNIADDLTEDEKDYLGYSLTIMFLLYDLGLSAENILSGTHSWTVDYVYYNDSKYNIEKVVFYSELAPSYNSEGRIIHNIYEITLFTGRVHAWYQHLENNHSLGAEDIILFMISFILSVAGFVITGPAAATIVSALGMFLFGYETGSTYFDYRYSNYIKTQIASFGLGPDDYFSMIYSVVLTSVIGGVEKRINIYEFGDEQ